MWLLVWCSLLLSTGLAWLLHRGESSVLTSLLFLIALGGWGTVAVHVLIRAISGTSRLYSQVNLAAASGLIMIIGVELFLRYGLGTYATYGERNGSRVYKSIYAYKNPTWYHLYQSNSTETWVRTEFTHTRRINALGLADRDVPVAKNPGEYRIIALGDSFTEGVGATSEETWVRVLERQVRAAPGGEAVGVMNAGISASDLLFEYVLLRDRLRPYQPDLVIVALNNSDITDVITRGGMERFRADGTVQGRPGPAWDGLYGISYITRHIVHDVFGYSWLLLRPAGRAAAEGAAAETLRSTLTAIGSLCADLGARFLVAFHPHEYEVRDGRYQPEAFDRLVDEVTAAQPVPAVDLLELYQRGGRVTAGNARDFYWPLDIHHNARGYALMGEMIAAEVNRRGLLARASQ